jgi:hypothetical protein
MTEVARRVLADCRVATELLEEEADETRFRILWVAAVALLRAVGHVLKKVDATRSAILSRAVEEAYRTWKQNPAMHAIFWDFIDDERNRVLKQYELGFLSGPIVLSVEGAHELSVLQDNLFCPIADGVFAGEDCRDLLRDAIAWWETQLLNVETTVATEAAALRAMSPRKPDTH